MTFTGQRQALHFAKSRHLFSRFSEQIIHVVLDHLEGQDTWAKEAFQRHRVFAEGLHQAGKEIQPGDIVTTTDVDEIPRPDVLLALKTCSGYPSDMKLECQIAYYSFGLEGGSWTSAKVNVWSIGLDAHNIRTKETQFTIEQGCWHCSYCFPRITDVINKLETFSHVEYNQLPYKDPGHIVAKTRAGVDLFDRDITYTQALDIDAPAYVKTYPRFDYMLNRSGASAGYRDYFKFFSS